MILYRTQKDIADYIGVTPEYLLMIKKGERNLSKKRQELLKEFYKEKLLHIKELIND